MATMQLHEYPRRILLTLAGHSPAIITETLYALTQTQQPAYIPTEIHVLTTSSGKAKVLETLLGERNILQQFCNEYSVPLPQFDETFIHVIQDKDGQELADLQTEADNEAAADFIVNTVRKLTNDETTSLHVSIAGGRKTMTYYLGYAMSVFGRIQDHMSHVLVDDRYAIPDFYYPTKASRLITNSRSNESFDAKNVMVKLGELPFIRLRDGLADDLLNKEDASYSELIRIAQRQLAPISVRVVYADKVKLYCGEEEISLPDAQLALYIWMLERHKNGKMPVSFPNLQTKKALAEEYKKVYEKLSNESGHYENANLSMMDTEYFGPPRTRINNKLRSILGAPRSKAYLLESSGSRNSKSYYLSELLLPDHISL